MSDIITKVRAALDSFSPEVTADEALQALEFRDRLKEITRELDSKIELAAIAWIEANGDLVKGEQRYYVAPNKSTKCRDVKSAIHAILKATGGDFDALVACLSSGAIKHGAARDILPGDEYEDLFETKTTADLKTGAATPKRLQKFDPNVLKGKISGASKRAPGGTDGPAHEPD